MSVDNIFPSKELGDTEQRVLAELIGHPLVKRYLRQLALADSKELLGLSVLNLEPYKLAQAHAVVRGKLEVIATLLEIEIPAN